jgi:acetyl/propionyl-CoA carboxylase alpha subunit
VFRSVLVANRGEIAVRIIRTLRAMGVRSVVVASIPDRRGLAVRSADAWVLLEGYSAAETYLDIEAVIAAAKAQGCDAIHPGYGFLAERADFAAACAAAGLTFIGPPPAVLRAVGDKAAARQLAVARGVPVVPGWDGPDDDETLVHQATRIGFPVMIKARGGGGGRGMREVHDPHALLEAVESARREAQAAFGDPGLLVEKLVTGAHHVEVQVVADQHGNVIHLGERDCSVQRRHQKLIEESPSPVVDDALRAKLTGAALKLARAIGYVNAGTFEFLVAPGGGFHFLEVNPRLQVEHPVTEMVTGLDLVELQLRVAAGELLPLRQEDVRFEGHAIEFRINAEDPWDDFKPSSGRLSRFALAGRSAGVRVDSGFQDRDEVPAHYDSLLAKLIIHGPDRRAVVRQARRCLQPVSVLGVRTNLGLQRAICMASDFDEAAVSTGWLEANLAGVLASSGAPEEAWSAAASTIRASATTESSFFGPEPIAAAVSAGAWLTDGVTTRFVATRASHRTGMPMAGGDEWAFEVVPPPPLPRRAQAAEAGVTSITAPLSGTVGAVKVAEGDDVAAGDLLLVLDAMKMEHRITAPAAGRVKTVHVRPGGTVREGDELVELF